MLHTEFSHNTRENFITPPFYALIFGISFRIGSLKSTWLPVSNF